MAFFGAGNRITGTAEFIYSYDADKNLVEKSSGGTGKTYWSMTPGIVAESDLSGDLQSEYVFFGGKRTARQNNPTGSIDPDGLDDYYVFRPLAATNGAKWDKIKADAPAHGNHVYLFNNDKATVKSFTNALHTPGAHVVETGHSLEQEQGRTIVAGSSHLSDGNVGTLGVGKTRNADGQTVMDPTPPGNVQASTVGIFDCNSADLQEIFPNTTFTGVDSGPDKGTSVEALDDSAAACTSTLVNGGSVDAATKAATDALPANNTVWVDQNDHSKGTKNMQDGDHAVTTKPKQENR